MKPIGRSRVRLRCVAVSQIAFTLVFSSVLTEGAGAHGPCACVKPVVAKAGQSVKVDTRAILAIWNPELSDFTTEPGLQLADIRWRVESESTLTVFDSQPAVSELGRKKGTNGFSFRVPAADPRRYLLLVYDGTEGGGHYTWEFVRVSGDAEKVTEAVKHDDTRTGAILWIVIAVVIAAGVGVFALRVKRRNP